MQKKKTNIFCQLNRIVMKIDSLPLWLFFLFVFTAVFTPFLILQEGSVFAIHDQLDEYMMNTVLTARHLGEGTHIFPEMMGGINASGLQPAAVLFVPLYRILPEFWAFIIQYAICFAAGFLGMYFAVKELTGSSILSLAAAGCFCLLPLYPVYGLSQMGIPLVVYGILRLVRGKKPWISLAIVLFYGLTSHLVYTGYVVLSLWLVLLAVMLWQKRWNKWVLVAFALLLSVYVFTNFQLFQELLFGQGDYVSHREEMIRGALPFWDTVQNMFRNSGQHSPSLHKYLIVPILFLLAVEGLFWKKLPKEEQRRYFVALGGMLFLVGIALFYGLCKSEFVYYFN